MIRHEIFSAKSKKSIPVKNTYKHPPLDGHEKIGS